MAITFELSQEFRFMCPNCRVQMEEGTPMGAIRVIVCSECGRGVWIAPMGYPMTDEETERLQSKEGE